MSSGIRLSLPRPGKKARRDRVSAIPLPLETATPHLTNTSPSESLRPSFEIISHTLASLDILHPLTQLQCLSTTTYDIVTPHLYRRVYIAARTAHSLLSIGKEIGVELRNLPNQMRVARERGRYFKPECRNLRRMVNWWYVAELVVESVPFAKMSEDLLVLALRGCTDCPPGMILESGDKDGVEDEISLLLAMDRSKHRMAPNLTSLVLSEQVVKRFILHRPLPLTTVSRRIRMDTAPGMPDVPPQVEEWSTESGDMEILNNPLLRALVFACDPIHLMVSLPRPVPRLCNRRWQERSPEVTSRLEGIHLGKSLSHRISGLMGCFWSRLKSLTCEDGGMDRLPNFPNVQHTYHLRPLSENLSGAKLLSYSPPTSPAETSDEPIVFSLMDQVEEPHHRLARLKSAFSQTLSKGQSAEDHMRDRTTWCFIIPAETGLMDDVTVSAEIDPNSGQRGAEKLERQLRGWLNEEYKEIGQDALEHLQDRVEFIMRTF